MKIKPLLLIVIVLLISVSCNKEAIENDDSLLIGNWFGFDDGTTFYFNVDYKSEAEFKIIDSEGKELNNIHGLLRKKDEKRLILKSLYYFDLIEAPQVLDTNIVFVLHGYENPVTMYMKIKIPKSLGGNEVEFYR
ncbi:MAG: hypothetical protein Kow0068_16760 [Marinilabiliales bacterium]